MNRGIARRTVFERRADVRSFLAHVAGAVRRGEIELHAYSLMTTHFHLLVRSPIGELSEGLRRIQNGYVRWFNRERGRDGALFRGRFRSKPVESLHYRRLLVRYIDQNAPEARIVRNAALYPYGSAFHHVRPRGPRWLCRDWIASEIERSGSRTPSRARSYLGTFGHPLQPGEVELVERRIRHGTEERDPLDDLVRAAPDRVRAWLIRRTELADGTRPGLPLATPSAVDAEMLRMRTIGSARGLWGGTRIDPRQTLRLWLLRNLGGLPDVELSLRTGSSRGTLDRLHRHHARLLADDPAYAAAAVRVTRRCLRPWGRSRL